MNRKNKNDKHGFVYSTDPNFQFQDENEQASETLPPQQQKIRIRLETKHRGGKTATIMAGFSGREEDLEDLGKKLSDHLTHTIPSKVAVTKTSTPAFSSKKSKLYLQSLHQTITKYPMPFFWYHPIVARPPFSHCPMDK